MKVLEIFADIISNLETTEEVVFLMAGRFKNRKKKVINPKDHQ